MGKYGEAMIRYHLLALIVAVSNPVSAAEPVRIIFDTDMDSDCDDLGALAVLHALADRGEAEILATVASSRCPSTPGCIAAINAFYGRPDLLLGRPRSGPQKPTKYADALAKAYPAAPKLADVPDAIDTYQHVLKAAPDGSVTIVTVGYLTNIAALLQAPGGEGLITAKVKSWVCMGGNFVGRPAVDDMKLGNNNFSYDKEAALFAVKHWPQPLTFVGREIGSVPSGLSVGANLKRLPENNPIRQGYALWFGGEPKNRHVADQTTVLFAVRGPGEYWKVETGGRMDLAADMTFRWVSDADSKQSYVLQRNPGKRADDRAVEKVIDDLMLATPAAK